MYTNLCRQLGITVPIVQAPMAGGWTTPDLVSAVSDAGGLGLLAAGRLTAAELREQIAEVRRRTQRPFGVNFLIPTIPAEASADKPSALGVLDQIRERLRLPAEPSASPPEPVSVAEGVDIALQARVPIISFAMGSPAPHVADVHAAGALVMASVTTVAEAQAAQAVGVDILVAQGAEAGGHRSTFRPSPVDALPLIGLLALLPAVVDAVAVPVVAAGGIMDGRGVVAERMSQTGWMLTRYRRSAPGRATESRGPVDSPGPTPQHRVRVPAPLSHHPLRVHPSRSVICLPSRRGPGSPGC